MPNKHGQETYKGYISPVTTGYPKEIRDEVRHVYGAWRVKHPGEYPRTKSRGARIAWAAAKRKYPELFRKHKQIERGTRQEHKEHPEFSKSTARKIATDHINEDPTSYTIKTPNFHIQPVKPAKTAQGRKKQVRDLHAAAQEQRRWSKEAERESVAESKRSKSFKKKGMPLHAKVLKDDATLAKGFEKDRQMVAKDLDIQAARIAAIKGN
jgi:hypothetical protein